MRKPVIEAGTRSGGKPQKVVSVRLSPDLHKRAKRFAIDHDCDLQDVVAQALELFLLKKRA
jgi:predicted transcriptional regulator